MSAHSRQIAVAYSLPLAIAAAASWHIAAQSMSRATQRAIILASLSFRHEAAQWLHAIAQMLQASMQSANLSCGISISLDVPELRRGWLSEFAMRMVDYGSAEKYSPLKEGNERSG